MEFSLGKEVDKGNCYDKCILKLLFLKNSEEGVYVSH